MAAPRPGEDVPLLEEDGRSFLERQPSSPVVLVVDDEEMVRDVARRLLERLGVSVVPASGARRCRELLASPPGPIRLALVDVSLKDGSCRVLLGEIHQRFPDCHLVAMSGYEPLVFPDLAGREVDFVQKPFSLKTLRGLLVKAGLFGNPADDGYPGSSL